MSKLDLNSLFKIAESSNVLDMAETQLRNLGDEAIADAIVKLQQDAGLEIDREMNGPDEEPAPGPQTAALRAAYQPTSLQRLQTVFASMEGKLQNSLVTQQLKSIFAVELSAMPASLNAPKISNGPA